MGLIRAHYREALVFSLALVAIIILIPIAMQVAVAQFIVTDLTQVPKTEAALVLGASVKSGKPSPVLKDRADTAIALYRSGKVSKILVTGDNGALSHDEVTPVRIYLLNAGIPPQDIFLDHAGFDTYSSMYRARDVFRARSLTIVTQNFHLPRALWLARHLGLVAYGTPAEGSASEYNYLREIPASGKALLDIFLRRVPRYLGPIIPLSGDGRATWY